MSILSLPAWFDAAECELQLVPEIRGFQGAFGGATEVQDLIGDHWHMRVTMPAGDFVWGGRTSALFNSLRGGANWLRMHDLARPVPLGKARGALVLASAAAQGANTLVISGAVGSNRVLNGSFEVDTNADGLADGWTRYSAGTVGALTHSRSGAVVWEAAWSQNLVAASLGSGTGDRQGVYAPLAAVSTLAGSTATASCRLLGTAGAKASLEVYFRNAGGTIVGSLVSSALTLTGSEQAIVVTGTCPGTAVSGDVYVYQHSAPAGAVGMYVDLVRVEPGSTAGIGSDATLLAGDKLGHNGEQLFEVLEDATATDAGVITVTITGRLRKAIASGQPIVWDKPQIPWQLADRQGVPTSYTRGRARGQQVEFVEAWQA